MIEEGEKRVLQLLAFALILVVVSGAFRLSQIGIERLDLSGSLFFVFALSSMTISIVLFQRNATYSALFAAAAMLLAMMVFGTCVLGMQIFGLTC